MSASVSVVVPTFNYGRFIHEALESVLRQTLVPEEIIVVDDGSTDDTVQTVRRFEPQVKYFRQENGGVCKARNRGVAESSGTHLAFLDADDTWEASKLEKQLERFTSDAEIGLVHCGMQEFDGTSGRPLELRLDGQEGWVADELLLWERPSVNVSGSALMVSREAFDSVGGFDPQIAVGEDWDFCYRIARKWKVGFVAEPLVNYRIHSAAAHRNVREMERGMSIFYDKAFASDEPLPHFRRRAMGNFHSVLAGSYFVTGDYPRTIVNAAKSMWNSPRKFFYFAGFPLRRMKKRSRRVR
jgi:glycosyltransferase involved in cell wall biosynthesis